MTTYDLPTLRDLLMRVEAATGPDRELDSDIAVMLGQSWDYAADWGVWGYGEDGKRIVKPVANPYTASIDAAVILIGRALPGWDWRVESLGEAGMWARVWERGRHDDTVVFSIDFATAALALIAALLKALIARDTQHGNDEG